MGKYIDKDIKFLLNKIRRVNDMSNSLKRTIDRLERDSRRDEISEVEEQELIRINNKAITKLDRICSEMSMIEKMYNKYR